MEFGMGMRIYSAQDIFEVFIGIDPVGFACATSIIFLIPSTES